MAGIKRSVIVVSFFVLLLGAVGAAGYFYTQYRTLKTAASPKPDQEIDEVLEAVAKHLVLPSGETPTVASVTDSEKLKSQPFFASAVNGDKVIIYSGAKKAILYRPDIDKIIDVAPVNIGSQATSSAETTPLPVRVILYNGTSTVGLTKTYEATLKTRVPDAVVVDRDNAKRQAYEKSVLIDLSGAKSTQAQELASSLGLEVSDLPEGETKPEGADFLIILGADVE